MTNYSGYLSHSISYDDPGEFDKFNKIMIIGAANSAVDILTALWRSHKQLYLAHRKDHDLVGLPDNVIQIRSPITGCKGSDVEFENGVKVSVSAIITATGYNTNISFLSPSCGVRGGGRYAVHPLYHHLFHPHFPSLAFFQRLYVQTPFILAEYQADAYTRYLTGSLSLPHVETMVAEAGRVETENYKRVLGSAHVDYYRETGEMTGRHFLSDYNWFRSEYDRVIKERTASPFTYRTVTQVGCNLVEPFPRVGDKVQNKRAQGGTELTVHHKRNSGENDRSEIGTR